MLCMLVKSILHKYALVAMIPDSCSQIRNMTINMVSEHKWMNYDTYKQECRWIDTKDIGKTTYVDYDITLEI